MRPSPLLVMAAAMLLGACAAPAGTTPGQRSPSASSSQPGSAGPSGGSTTAADPLLALRLVDVASGQPFTLGDLAADRPVLLETMATWCPNCRQQQRAIVDAHALGDFHSVSIDVDLSETAADLAEYADREGFDWRFAVADASLYQELQQRFGVAVTNPPSTPLLVIGSDGSVRPLEFGRGVRSAQELLTELGLG
ncbi:MAG: TlpA family protein disulfide reductase [Chloroflexota bacterium]|nr:TlpA family protein disulfide reductase [Chloroflexota bacterium]